MRQSYLYINREISWLRFNDRVLAEVDNNDNPLLERVKFLSIASGNLDEFFMVRIGALARKLDTGNNEKDMSGLTLSEQMDAVMNSARRHIFKQYSLLQERILPGLEVHGIHMETAETLNKPQLDWLFSYFTEQIMPVLTPYAINHKRPFPLLAARCVYLAVAFPPIDTNNDRYAVIAVPNSIPRAIILPFGRGKVRFILLEDLISIHAAHLFNGEKPISCQAFRITRNTDFLYEDSNAGMLIMEMRKNLRHRKLGKIVRFEIAQDFNKRLLEYLMRSMQITPFETFELYAPLQIDFFLKQLYGLPGFDNLRYKPFIPHFDLRLAEHETIFRTINKGDLFFHHPYDSFDPILRFIREASEDPRVLAIKQTLYRISGKSPIVASLLYAAQQGKQVTVLVEVRARFDEENNINWCLTLEKAGCHVIYGVPKLKVHSKITYIVRREEAGLRHYLHLGTGNYNDVTAKVYSDMGIMTCNEQLGKDANSFFNRITGYSHTTPFTDLIMSPDDVRSFFKKMIQREIHNAVRGLPAIITAKMNSLVDTQMIELFYKASEAGVQVNLIVRGVCCLNNIGYPNITVRSIVGRFLEHSRVYVFHNSGKHEVYLSSADLMPRNLDRRIELLFPVKDTKICDRILSILSLELSDNVKSWEMGDNEKYHRVKKHPPEINCQDILISERLQNKITVDIQPKQLI